MELLFIVIGAIIVAVLLTAVFAGSYRGDEGAWAGLWVFFLIILLFALAGGIWTAPYGPVWGGIPWFGIIFWGLVIALLLAAFAAPPRTRSRGTVPATEEEESALAIGAIFWVLIALLVIAIIVGILR